MNTNLIRKSNTASAVQPNVVDYEATRRSFEWGKAAAELGTLPDQKLNIAHTCVDRHATGPRADHVALRWLATSGARQEFTYADLSELSGRFANALNRLGVQPGDVMSSLLGRVPPLYIGMLGILKAGGVFSPLFSAFGPEPIRQRMVSGNSRVLLTTPKFFEEKIAPQRAEIPSLDFVIVVPEHPEDAVPDGTLNFWKFLDSDTAADPAMPRDPEDVALLHFTSGTTGKPKGALHVHGAIVAHHHTGRFALDLHPEDVFWCTANPGWVTGTSYGIISPLSNGVTMLVDQNEFNTERWYKTLQDEKVSVWYTAPTAIRMLMKAGSEIPKKYDLSTVRFIASVGEPLNPEGVIWGQETLGLPIHDNWWQTETGGIMIANYASMDIKPGSMGKPLPGITAAIVQTQTA